MTAREKPARRPSRTLAVASAAPVPPLTDAELALLAYFRAMDDRSQAFIGRLVVDQAENCPRRATPTLRLISGGVHERQ